MKVLWIPITTLTVLFCLFLPAAEAQADKATQLAAREHVNKGNFYLGRRNFQEAINEYQEAIRLDSSNSVARDNIVLTHNNWGILHFSQKKYAEAQSAWQKALELDPYNQLAKHNIAVLKQTLTRQGLPMPGSEKEAAAKAAKAAEKQTSSIKLLTPGIKISTPSTASSEGESTETAAEPAAAATPGADTTTHAGFDAGPLPAAAPSASAQSGSIEDLLAGLEVKIYGQKQSGLSVIKRLEKVEVDSTGKPGSGTIKERLDCLRRSYGL